MRTPDLSSASPRQTPARPSHARRAGSALLIAVVLAGCGTPTPFERPTPPVPAAWTDAATPAGAVSAANLAWQNYFTDPRLQALIARALANNRDLQSAAAKVQQSRADFKSVDADRLPSVNGQVLQSRTYTPSDLSTASSSQRIDAQAVVSYEVDFWGRVASMSASARAAFLASEEARRQVQLSLIADVASAYYSLLEKEEIVEFAVTTLDLRRQSLALSIVATKAGATDEDEIQQMQAAVEQTKSTLAQFEHLRNVAAHLLDFLVGGAATDLPPGRSLGDQQPGPALAAGVPSEVLLRRPDVRAAEQRLAAASADIDAARAAFLPKVMLTAALGMASPALAGLLSGGAWSYQPIASLPIFDGGRTAANLDAARARRTMLVAEYEKTVQQAFREVADQLSARQALQLQLDAAIAMQRTQAVRLGISRGRYEAGVTSYREVLEAQRTLIATRQNTIGLRRAAQDASAGLYKALGGGSDVEAPPVRVAGDAPSTPRQ